MTETSSLYTTYPLTHPPQVTTLASSASPLPNGTFDPNAADEEEYTIKCICVFADDDGNTVYCEQCDTWQHILCYYHDKKKVPDVHFCVDCQTRDLDSRKATERQRRAREHLEGGDRRIKKPSSKTSKKKQKDVEQQTNGWTNNDRHDSLTNGRDQPPPPKKPKTSHRTSGSVVSVNGESRKRAHSNVQSYPSPSKSPQDLYRFPFIPQYTAEFLELYERDNGNTSAECNEYTIPALNHLSRWKTDLSLVVSGTDSQPNHRSPFVHLDRGSLNESLPQVTLDSHENNEIVVEGKHPIWRFLRLQEPVKKDTIVGEIRGEVGMLEEYCRQQSSPNRWTELTHPDPFVFFHPHMDVYIDSRQKGTQFRYLRRSCQPNVTLRTLVTDDEDARHCFVANQDISAGSELTAAWFINHEMFDLNSDKEDSEHAFGQRSDWISRVLANFGDCACGNSNQCPWARLDRRSTLKPSEQPAKQIAGRKRKNKSKQAISPLSTGQATNSRAGSEVVKGADDDDQDDRRSTSGSTRSGPRSRDLTPVNVAVAVLDADPILGGTLTEREKRKIRAAEKAFEKEKQKATDDRKKKKRTSGGSTLSTPNPGVSKHSPTQIDIKHFSDSPPPARQIKDMGGKTPYRQSRPVRPAYVSIGVQTDPEVCDIEMPPLKRVRYVTPTQRLLNKIRANRNQYCQNRTSPSLPSSMAASGQDPTSTSEDVEMKDVGSGQSPISPYCVTQSPELSPTTLRSDAILETGTIPLPSQAAHTQTNFKAPALPKLHLSTLPPVPAFPSASSMTPGSSGGTPSLTTPTNCSPQASSGAGSLPNMNASIVMPSPVKKKMSLGDYMSRRNLVTTPSSERGSLLMGNDVSREDSLRKSSTVSSDAQSEPAIKSDAVAAQDAATRSGLDDSAVDDAAIKDESEAEYSPPDASPIQPEAAPADSSPATEHPPLSVSVPDKTPPKDVADVLAQLAQLHAPLVAKSQSPPTGSVS